MILAIDPGTTESAYVLFDGTRIHAFAKVPNEAMREILISYRDDGDVPALSVEMIASYGMAVGAEVFETCYWIGRFIEVWNGPYKRVYRKHIKSHLCGSIKAKDSNVRQALIDRFGPPGVKKAPGITFGLAKDLWAAFALAVYAYDIAEGR